MESSKLTVVILYNLLERLEKGEEKDILAEDAQLPRLRADHRDEGGSSRVYFQNTGAYTVDYTDAGQKAGFYGVRLPAVYYLAGGRIERNPELPGSRRRRAL